MLVRRPMLLCCTSIIAGMYLVALLRAETIFAVVLCALITTIIACFRNKNLYSVFLFSTAFLLFCFGMMRFFLSDDIQRRSLCAFYEQECIVSGEISDVPKDTENYIKFTLKTTSVTYEDIKHDIKEKLSVICYKNDSASSSYSLLKKGDIITLQDKIRLPNQAYNTSGYDYRRYLKSKGIYFEMSTDAEQVHVVGHRSHFFSDAVHFIRTSYSELFEKTFPAEECGILIAYLIGDSSKITPEVSSYFSGSGLLHVLSVSGMHVTIFLASLTAFLNILRISKRKQLFFSLGAVVLYVLFTGASIATIRAGFTVFIAFFAKLVYKHSDRMTALSEAAAILCIWNPHVLFDMSFILSFSATFGIILFSDNLSRAFAPLYKNIPSKFKIRIAVKTVFDLIAVGIVANIFVIPVSIMLFHEFSIMSVIAMIFVNPVLMPILVAGFLFCIIGFVSVKIAYPVAGFLYICAKYMIEIARVFSSVPFSRIAHETPSLFLLLLYCIGLLVFYFLFIKRWKIGYLTALYSFVLLFFIFSIHTTSVSELAEVYFINVGQGDCSVLKAPGDCDVLIDGGGKKEDGAIGENVVKPYLIQNGIYDIEYVIATHGHEDHVNGLTRLLDVMKVKHLLAPKGFGLTEEGRQLLEKADEMQIPVTFVKHGDILEINDKMKIRFIMPDEKTLAFLAENDENERSLLFRIEYGDVSFLYTGDISQRGEKYTISLFPEYLKADVLKVAHHGSKGSNSEEFLTIVDPSYAYIPVGENFYGHPHKEVTDKLDKMNIIYYRADIHRDVCFYFDEHKIRGIKHGGNINGGTYELR